MKIDWESLSPQQLSNCRSSITAYNEKSSISSLRPPVLYVELTRNCIARCDFCRGEKWINSESNNMDNEIFDILLRDYIPYTVLVDLRGGGESLMLPGFSYYLKEVSRYKPTIRLTTNLGCGSKETLQSLIDYNVFISVSFDAADKDIYESIRKGVSYDTVVRNIEFLTSGMLKKHGSLKDKIRLGVQPLQKKNLEQIGKIFEFAHY